MEIEQSLVTDRLNSINTNQRACLLYTSDGLAGLINTVEKVNYLLTVVLLLHGLKVHILMLMIMFTF